MYYELLQIGNTTDNTIGNSIGNTIGNSIGNSITKNPDFPDTFIIVYETRLMPYFSIAY